jgi:C-terminal processing protease CtpA/Prc
MKQRRWMVLGVFLAGSALSLAQTLDSSTRATIDGVIDQLKTNYLFAKTFDWETLRKQTLEVARKTPNGQEPRAAIMGLLETINDPAIVLSEWLTQEQVARRNDFGELGLSADATTRIIHEVFVGGAAIKAGLRVGDEIVLINNKPPKIQFDFVFSTGKIVPITVKRGEQTLEFQVSVSKLSEALAAKVAPMRAGRLGKAAYVEPDRGFLYQRADRNRAATSLQFTLRSLEQDGACGYIVDFRRVTGGFARNVAGFGPLLTQNRNPLLKIQADQISYDPDSGDMKWDVYLEASLTTRPWKPQQPDAPIVVLTSQINLGWLPIVFKGRKQTYFVGETQAIAPFAYGETRLKDGTSISFPSGYVFDRLGHQYDAPLEIDETAPTDWTVYGSKNDTVIQAAQAWLETQPACQ